MSRLFSKIKWILLSLGKYTPPAVLFTSFEGQYNDNPKYISIALHNLNPSIRIIWAVSNKTSELLPDYVESVEYNSNAYFTASYRCQVIVDNVIGYRWKALKRGKTYPRLLLTAPKQLNISTWHGTPIKRIGLDCSEFKGVTEFTSSADYLISGCKYTYERLHHAFKGIPGALTGTPRNDILVSPIDKQVREQIKKRLGLPLEKKIVIYAPTFRNNSDESGVIQMQSLEFKRLISIFERVFGGEWIFVFRVHHSVLKKIDTGKLASDYQGLVYNGNLHDDMADYLAVTDALITDYSGSIFDFALTGRPGFLYTPDKDHYINEERGTYIPLEELPYPYAVELEDFYKLIEEYDEKISKRRIDEFNQRIGNAETGHASETIARAIIKYIETGKKENLLQ